MSRPFPMEDIPPAYSAKGFGWRASLGVFASQNLAFHYTVTRHSARHPQGISFIIQTRKWSKLDGVKA